jgi:hypothetical protein
MAAQLFDTDGKQLLDVPWQSPPGGRGFEMRFTPRQTTANLIVRIVSDERRSVITVSHVAVVVPDEKYAEIHVAGKNLGTFLRSPEAAGLTWLNRKP